MKQDKRKTHMDRIKEAGSVFTSLIGAVALVGVVNAGVMQTLSGPVKTMAKLNQQTLANSDMLASARIIALEATVGGSVDPDSDSTVEALAYKTGVTPSPTGGGGIPDSVNVSQEDPWKTPYGYCTWDHGTVDAGKNDGGVGTDDRLQGVAVGYETEPAIAIISAGPNSKFETSCAAYDGAGSEGLVRVSGSDDLILYFTYEESGNVTGGVGGSLWELRAADTVGIDMDVVVGDGTARNMTTTGDGSFRALVTDGIGFNNGTGMTPAPPADVVVLQHPLQLHMVNAPAP